MKKGLMALFIVSILVGACFPNYSDGYRVGVIQKFSKKGFIFKSWEGEMVMQTVATDSKGNSIGLEKFFFNVGIDDTANQEKIIHIMETGQKCKITYRQWGIKPPTIDNEYVVLNAEPISQ